MTLLKARQFLEERAWPCLPSSARDHLSCHWVCVTTLATIPRASLYRIPKCIATASALFLLPWFLLHSWHRKMVFYFFQVWPHCSEFLSVNSRTAVSFHLSLSFCLTQFICLQDITSQGLTRVSQHI